MDSVLLVLMMLSQQDIKIAQGQLYEYRQRIQKPKITLSKIVEIAEKK